MHTLCPEYRPKPLERPNTTAGENEDADTSSFASYFDTLSPELPILHMSIVSQARTSSTEQRTTLNQ